MKKVLVSSIFAASFLAFFIMLVPQTANAEVGRVLTVREKSKKVKIITLDVGHYSTTSIDDISGVKLHWATNPAFNNKRSKTVSAASLISKGRYDADARKFTIKVKRLNGSKGYYFRAKLVGVDSSVSDRWKESSRIITLPPKVKELRVPRKKKTSSSVRLKWNHPRRCQNLNCTYFVKVWKRSNNDLVATKWSNRLNYIDLTSLAIGKKYFFRAQSCLSTTVCNQNFSARKYFRR